MGCELCLNKAATEATAEESGRGGKGKTGGGGGRRKRLPRRQGLDQTMILTRFSLGNLLASFLVSLSWKRNLVFSQIPEL